MRRNYCSAIWRWRRLIAALLGRFLPKLRAAGNSGLFSCLKRDLRGLGSLGRDRPDRQLAFDIRDHLGKGLGQVVSQNGEARLLLHVALVHVERAVDLDLECMPPEGGLAVMLGDEAARVRLVADHRVAASSQS